MTHVAFSLHLYTFLLLVFCVALVAAKLSAWLGLGGLDSPLVDNVLSVANLAAARFTSTWQLVRSMAPQARSGLPRVGLALAAGAIVLGYRFVLFLITLYAT